MQTRAKIRAYIRGRFSSPLYRPPPLHESAIRIQQLAARRTSSVDETVSVVAGDPILAGRVFAVARSPFYSRSRRPRDLRQAVMRLGIRAIRDISMEVSLQSSIFDRPVFADALRALGSHSRATAYAMPSVARAARLRFEDGFIAGLFHDIGAAGALLCVADGTPDGEECDAGAVLAAIDDVHGALGMEMIASWDLPATLRTVVWRHQEVELHGLPLVEAACVCIAEQIATRLGRSFPSSDPGTPNDRPLDCVSDAARERGMRALRLDEERLDDIAEEVERLLDEMEPSPQPRPPPPGASTSGRFRAPGIYAQKK